MRTRSVVTRLVSAAVLSAAVLAGPTALQASAKDAYDSPASATYEKVVVKATNAERAKQDRHALKASSCVNKYAERQARAMAKKHLMYHQSLGPILKKCHLNAVGENVAYGYASGAEVTDAWMHSEGHRTNILTRGYRLIGVGAVQDGRGVWYVSQVFGTKA